MLFETEQKYPTLTAMEELAAVLDLTLKQVQGWFVEKRRRDKSKDMSIEPPCLSKKLSVVKGRNGLGVAPANRKIHKQQNSLIVHASSDDADRIHKNKRKKKSILIQDFLTPDYILRKIFRKDGPPLGVAFDSLPSRALHNGEGMNFQIIICCCVIIDVLRFQVTDFFCSLKLCM